VILTSRLSASASEILAGAMKDYKRAVIVGDDQTFGKGTVQAVINLPPTLGALKVTTSMFFLPGGESTQRQGVHSDVVVPSPFSTDEFGERALPNNLPEQAIAPFVYQDSSSHMDKDWTPVSTDLVSRLSEKSAKRVASSDEFKKIQEQLKKAQENKGIVRLADVLKEQADAKKTKKPELTRKEKEDKERGPEFKEALNILADMVTDSAPLASDKNANTAAKSPN
jgi:carboxyl-terminal processing protease